MPTLSPSPLIGEVSPSPAGPISGGLAGLRTVPTIDLPLVTQILRFTMRQKDFMFSAGRSHGDVFHVKGTVAGGPVVTSHPDHVKSIFTASPDLVPTLTTESPLAPVVGPHAVLTTNGARHMSQRKLLLPQFHGGSVAKYQSVIEEATSRQLDRWEQGQELDMSRAMQSLTLEVILA